MIGKDFIPLSQRDHLSIGRMVSISAGWFANSINWTLIFALSTPIMEKLNINGIPATLIWFAGAIIVFIFQPLSGAYSDQCTFRWGRRRIWIVGSMFFSVIGMIFVMLCIDIGKKVSKEKWHSISEGIFIAALLLWYVGASTFQGPQRALASDNCPPHQQMLMSNICNIINSISALIANLIGALSLYKYTNFSQEQFIILIGTILSVITIIISCISAPEEPLLKENINPNKSSPIIDIIIKVRQIPKPVLMVGIENMLSQCGFYEKGVFETAFFATNIYKGDNSLDASPEANALYQKGLSFAMMVSCIMNGTNFLYGLVNTWVIDNVGMRLSYGLAMVLSAICFLIVVWIRNKWALLVIWLALGVGSVFYSTVPNAVTALTVNQDDLAAYLGIVNSFNVIGQQFANFVIGMGLGSVWKEPYMKIACGCVPTLASAIGAFFIVVPDSSPKDEKEKKEIDSDSSYSDQPNAL